MSDVVTVVYTYIHNIHTIMAHIQTHLPHDLALDLHILRFVGALLKPHQPVQLHPYPLSRVGHEPEDGTNSMASS